MPFNYSPFQAEQLPPEEQAQVPMLTNIPETAESAWGRGQDVYFLSDRPETEEHLAQMAQKTPERAYKQVLRDVRSVRPSEDQLLLSEARRDFGANEGAKMLGFDPNNPPNPGEVAKAARDQYFNLATPEQIQTWDEKTLKLHYSEADKRGKAAYQEAMGKVNAAKNVLSMFDKSWTERQRQIREEQKRVEEQAKPGQGIMAIHPDTRKKQWYFPKSKTWGPEIPEGVTITQDAEGNSIYTPTSQAGGKAPGAKPSVEKTAKKVSYVGWNKEGKEVFEEVDAGDTEAIQGFIEKGYIPKKDYDAMKAKGKMGEIDLRLAKHEAMQRIGAIPKGMPSAAKNKGRIVRDTDTGKRYKSDGIEWRPL